MVVATALLGFEAGGESLAIDAGAVQEIISVPHVSRVPNAPPSLEGVASVRGQAVPILSVAMLRGRERGIGKRVLILHQQPPVGLLVDNVASIRSADSATPLDLEALLRPALRSAGRRTIGDGRALRKEGEHEKTVTLGLLIFAIGTQEFALPLDQVKETMALSANVTPVPQSDAAVMGTISHGGSVLPVFALATLLAMRPREQVRRPGIVVALAHGRPVGFAVDELRSVVSVSMEALDPVPTVIARRLSEAKINAICRLDDGKRLVSVLGSATLLQGVEAGQLPEFDRMTISEDRRETEMTDPFVLFQIGDQAFGLPAVAVETVVQRPERLTKLPRSPDFIDGIMNLHGRVVPIIDQRRRFGAPVATRGGERVMIVSLGNLQAGFVVDHVKDVLRMPREAVSPAPDITDGTKVIDRVATLEGGERIVLLIDPAELLDETERQMLIALRNRASRKS
jgi:purine-binding chemotaxis protein CheW